MARRERVRPQRARSADERNRERLAGAGGVAADEVQLQRNGVGRSDRHVREPPEAGRDAVDGLAAREPAFDELARPRYPLARGGGDRYRRSAGYRVNLLEGEVPAVDLDSGQNCDQSGTTGFANGGPL